MYLLRLGKSCSERTGATPWPGCICNCTPVPASSGPPSGWLQRDLVEECVGFLLPVPRNTLPYHSGEEAIQR